MEYSKIEELRNLYFEKSKEAKRGKKVLDKFLKLNNTKGLSFLLRYHTENKISSDETWLRDDIDFFLNYYSIISLAYLTGFISKKEIDNAGIKNEIKYYLENAALKKYYTVSYPILLPEILIRVISNINSNDNIENITENNYFNRFHQLNQSIDNDDVHQFLWFLDGGSNDGFNITSLNTVLGAPSKYLEIIDGPKNALQKALLGFFDYLIFIEKFFTFLGISLDEVSLSAYWHYHSYWFKKIKIKLDKTIYIFFDGLADYVYKPGVAKKSDYYQMRWDLLASQKKFIGILQNLLNEKYEAPLLIYNKRLEKYAKRNSIVKIVEGEIVKGIVIKVLDNGAVLEIMPEKIGFLDISEIAWDKNSVDIKTIFKLATELTVKIISIDERANEIKLSIKQLSEDPWLNIEKLFPINSVHLVEIIDFTLGFVTVKLQTGFTSVFFHNRPRRHIVVGKSIAVKILSIDKINRKINLRPKNIESISFLSHIKNFPIGSIHRGIVKEINAFGAKVVLENAIDAIVPKRYIRKKNGEIVKVNESLKFIVVRHDLNQKRIVLNHSLTWKNIPKKAKQTVQKSITLKSAKKS